MLLKDLRKAIWEGKLVDITGVKLRSWGADHQLPAVLHIGFDIPSVENKPISDSLDIKEVSLSTKPKYDPCRKLREGDKVRFQKVNNRFTPELNATIFVGTLGRVAFDERESGAVKVYCFDGVLRVVDANYLELVTPMEELAPYSVHESEVANCFDIVREKMCVMTFPYGPKEAGYYRNKLAAKEAAEAECNRLNAEWRKEQK